MLACCQSVLSTTDAETAPEIGLEIKRDACSRAASLETAPEIRLENQDGHMYLVTL